MTDIQINVPAGAGLIKSTTQLFMFSFLFVVSLFIFLSLLLWIDRGTVLPEWLDSEELERQKRNDWWLQIYHEERIGKRPTGILRHSSSRSSSEDDMSDTMEMAAIEGEENAFSTENIHSSGGGKKKVKHVRFEIPLPTTSSISTVLSEEKDERMNTIKELGSCHSVNIWEVLTTHI